MSKNIVRYKKQRGDTIIEVLLAMAVLGMVLGTSFGIVNRSLAVGRDAQERSEATKFAESQLEKLKTASSDPENGFFNIDPNSVYCVDDSLEAVLFGGSETIQNDVDLTTYPDKCKVGPDGRYRLSIVRVDNVFTVRTRWTPIRGNILNEVKMTYRTYSYSSREYPVVVTKTNIIVAGNRITVRGTVIDQGKSAVTRTGFVYNTLAGRQPSEGTMITAGVGGLGEFQTDITGLPADATYYIRAFAENTSGINYGSEVPATTPSISAPTLTTASISNATTSSSVTAGGEVIDDGNSVVKERGVVYGTTQNPTTSSTKVSTTGTLGSFTVTIPGLADNKTYYARSYAINLSNLTGYGPQVSFLSKVSTTPSVTTSAINNTLQSSTTASGNVTSGGNSTVTARGFAYATTQNPTTSNSNIAVAGTTGAFSGTLTMLADNKTYYVRAYAQNANGTTYGNQVSFTKTTYTLGSRGPGGGIVFYDQGGYNNGWRYLESSTSNQGAQAGWGCSIPVSSPTTSFNYGDGLTNTDTILANCAVTTPASIARSFRGGGLSDWYLPSYFELSKMNANSNLIGGFNNAYWSSTIGVASGAKYPYGWDFNRSTGYLGTDPSRDYVRAIRRF